MLSSKGCCNEPRELEAVCCRCLCAYRHGGKQWHVTQASCNKQQHTCSASTIAHLPLRFLV